MESFSAFYARYLRRVLFSNRRLIFVGLSLYIAGFALGRLLYSLAPAVHKSILDVVTDKFLLILDKMEKASSLGGGFILFWNNIKICFISMLLSVFSFVIIFTNGVVLGVVSSLFETGGHGLAKFIAVGILPHGIFELLGFFLAGALGIRATVNIIKLSGAGQDESSTARGRRTVGGEIASAIRGFLMIVVPLIFVAAIIEVTLTPFLMDMFIRR